MYCDKIYGSSVDTILGLVGCGLAESGWGLFVMWLRANVSYVHWDVGACDYFRSNISDIRYAVTSVGCYYWGEGGATYLTVLDPLWYVDWNIGACLL